MGKVLFCFYKGIGGMCFIYLCPCRCGKKTSDGLIIHGSPTTACYSLCINLVVGRNGITIGCICKKAGGAPCNSNDHVAVCAILALAHCGVACNCVRVYIY